MASGIVPKFAREKIQDNHKLEVNNTHLHPFIMQKESKQTMSANFQITEKEHLQHNINILVRGLLIARIVPFIPTPIWGGTRVFQDTHHRHHVYFATNKDPWISYYSGHPLKALFFNLIEPENNLYNFIKYKGFDVEMFFNLVYNVAFFCISIFFFQQYYLALFISARIVHGLTVFFFNFYLHRSHFSADADYGTYEKSELIKPYASLLKVIFGQSVINGFMYHNRHHCVGQWHVQTQYYDLLEDTNSYSPHFKTWPVKSIKIFENNSN